MKNNQYLFFCFFLTCFYLIPSGFSQIKDQKAWQRIKFSYQTSDFENFLNTYPHSHFAKDAQRKLDSLHEKYAFYEAIKSCDTIKMQHTIARLNNDSLKKELSQYTNSWKTWLASGYAQNYTILHKELNRPIDELLTIYQDTSYFFIIHLMLIKLNEIRKRHHIKPVTMNYALAYEAHLHAKAMSQRNFLSHIDPVRGNPYIRAKRANFQGEIVGENIAVNQHSINELFSQWMKSKNHRNNILNKTYNVAGMGFYISKNLKSKYLYFYVNLFGLEE